MSNHMPENIENENHFPPHLEAMPRIFRVISVYHKTLQNSRFQYTAYLFHDLAAIRVRWFTACIDSRLQPGVLVSPRWLSEVSSTSGTVQILRLAILVRPEPQLNLFKSVPHTWVKDRKLVKQAAALIDALPESYRLLFNAIFWNGDRFKRYCMGPSSKNNHHNYVNGNLIHSVDVALRVHQECLELPTTSPALGILAGLLHDAGKADEYRKIHDGTWKLSDRGTLLGHKVTVTEWIAYAIATCKISMPVGHYEALLHCLTSTQSAPEWLGIRQPQMLEAALLSGFDRLSGQRDLMQRCSSGTAGWGVYHEHLRGRVFQIGKIPPNELTHAQ
jgi:3'-5' exoribonuclease